VKPFVPRFALELLFVLLFTSSLLAASTNQIPQYSSRLWQTDDGLPHNSVQAIIQTQDGYLWVGTGEGLARFDGVRFTLMDQTLFPEIKRRSFTALHQSSDGSFWIGTEGEGLICWKAGKFLHYNHANGLPNNFVRTIYEGRDGAIWIGTTGGLTRFKNGKFSTFTQKEGLAHNTVRSICEDNQGNLWIATALGLSQYKNGAVHTLSMYPTRVVCHDQQDAVWIGTDHGLNRMKNGKYFWNSTKDKGLSDNFVSAIYADRKGQVWIGTYSGLNRFVEGKLLTEFTSNGAAYDHVNTIFEDREGNIWVGTKEGLHRLKVRPFTAITKQEGLTHNTVTSVLEDRTGVVWGGTWGGGLNQLKKERITAFPLANRFANDLILSMCEGRDGSLWFGADYDGGLYRLERGALTHYTTDDGLENAAIRVICEDREGNIWIGTSRSLTLFRNGKFTRYTTQDGLAGNTIRVIFEDDEQNLWIGTNDGLSRRKNGKLTSFTTKDGLSCNAVIAIYEDKEKNLWLGTQGGGLNRLSKVKSQKSKVENPQSSTNHSQLRFTAYTARQGLFSDDVFEILEDDYGYFWMSCLNGIFRVSKKSLDDFDRGKIGSIPCISYGKDEGMASTQCNSVSKPAGWKGKDGRLWFPTTKGLVVAGPNIKVNDTPPPVAIEEVMVDKRRIVASDEWPGKTKDSSPIAIPPGHGELELHYTALSFQAPEKNRFKYKLEGMDSDWVEAGTRRVAYYNNIYPGHYRFRVMACNNDGIWNDAGASLAFVWLPHFWQAKWFFGLVGLAVVGSVGGAVRYVTWKKVQRKMKLLEQQNVLERERGRIAQDIHDDVGANLTQISLLCELTKMKSGEPKQVISQVEKISDTARELVQAMDEIVWAVNPKNDTLPDLTDYIFQFAEEFLALTPIRCRLERPMPLPPHPVSAEVRHNLFLAVKEALNNSVKYATATEIWLRLSLEDSEMRVVVEDNGCGFSANTTRQFGNGLKNMKKRMEEVGGRFEIESKIGQGTRILLGVDLNGKGTAAFHSN